VSSSQKNNAQKTQKEKLSLKIFVGVEIGEVDYNAAAVMAIGRLGVGGFPAG
jgi:hypothetical protein